MNNNSRLAAAAAIVVAVVGVGAFAFLNNPNVAAPATANPSDMASPSPGVAGAQRVPLALQGRWVGEPRVVPELPEPPVRNALVLSDMQLTFPLSGQGSATQFASVAELAAPDQLRLRGATTDGGCKPRDEGLYTFKLDASGTALTLTPISDACGPRSTALAGDWARVGCTDDEGWCLGDLAPGTHKSVIFTPLVPAADWQFHYGQVSYTVPAGWRNTGDCPWCYVLARLDAPVNTNVSLWSEVAAHKQADQCSGGQEPGIARTAEAIVSWLATLPGLVTTNPEAVSIGGLNGKMIDLAVAPSWTASCPYAYASNLPLVSTFSDPILKDGFDWNIQGEGRTRIIALDLGDGRALVINIEAQNKADYDALLPGAMEVVNSLVFKR